MKSSTQSRLFQIFRAGTHTPMSGRPLSFAPEDLASIACRYNWRKDLAPICLGHPADNAPSYGEVTDLFAEQGKLFAHALVSPGLVMAVRNGHYKFVSPSFNLPAGRTATHLAELRHVGFLGATPPAVKGMPPLSFAEAKDPVVLCFGEGGEVFSNEQETHFSEAEAIAARVLNYREILPSLTYWQAFHLATTR